MQHQLKLSTQQFEKPYTLHAEFLEAHHNPTPTIFEGPSHPTPTIFEGPSHPTFTL